MSAELPRHARARALLLPAVAFLSGAAALVFETLWYRAAGIVFGNGIWASSLVLAAFMAGLAAGNALAARLADRATRPILVYAWIELAIGASAAALVIGLPSLTEVFAPLFRRLLGVPWLLNALRLALAFVLLMIPASAMGATLPVLVKALRASEARFGRALGRLYGWNTLGAVVGALFGEAWWIGVLGIRGSALAAAGLNACAAASAFALAQAVEGSAPSIPAPVPRPAFSREAARLLGAAFASGALFLALEVVWFRFLSLFVYGTSLVFAVMLATVLAGIGLGGLAAGRWLAGRAAGALPALALLSGCAVLACYAGFAPVREALLEPGRAAATQLHVALLTIPLVLPNALLSGALFPLLGDAARTALGGDARTTGLVTLANTLGAALGSLAGGFLLLPLLGIERSLLALGLAYAPLAALVLLRPRALSRATWLTLPALAAALAAAALAFPLGALRERHLLHPLALYDEPGSQVVAVREGRLQTIVYVRTDRFGSPRHYRMLTDGFSMSGTHYPARRYMKAFVYLPVALHPNPRRALLISYGVGSTAKALTDTRSLERIDVVDISPEILEMGELVYPTPAQSPLRDPRVRVHVEDGRFFLQTREERYDLITSEPSPPKLAGVVNLFTREYFSLVRSRLAEGGVASYWLPVHDLSERDLLAIARAFCDVFADCTLWTGSGLDWMLVGTRDAAWRADSAHFRRQWQDPRLAPELRALGFEAPEQLLATFLASSERLAELTRGVAPLVDDFPHRLSNDPVLPTEVGGLPLVRTLFDADAARQSLRRSEFAARHLDPELVEAALPWFAWQEIVNARLVPGSGDALSERDLHRVLTRTSLHTLVLWLLGSDAAEQAIVADLPERAGRHPGVSLARGIGALAERDYARAAQAFARAREARGPATRARALEILALCMAGERVQAGQRARELLATSPQAARNDAYWAWLSEAFGLADPRRAPAG